MLIVLLIVAAAASLVLGLAAGPFVLVWLGLGLSVAGLVLIGVALRVFRVGAEAASAGGEGAPGEMGEAESDAADPEPDEPRSAATGTVSDGSTSDSARAEEPDTGVVVVIPGRRRYHWPGCRLLSGREAEEIARDEAVEEGFTACTVCAPTTVRSPAS